MKLGDASEGTFLQDASPWAGDGDVESERADHSGHRSLPILV